MRFAAGTAALLALVAAYHASAQGTHLWTQSRMEEFEKGTPQGVAVTSDGHLREAPGLTEVATTPSTFVWSVAAGANGTAFVGTASPATVLRIGPDGKQFTLFETKDVSVQALRLGRDGWLYAATLPSGRVYRLKADATAKQDEASAAVVFDAGKVADGEGKAPESKPSAEKTENKPHYIWDLAFDSQGRLYIAMGGPAAIYRVDPAKSVAAPNQPVVAPELFFKSDEEHIRVLAWDAKGNLIAGTDGSGLVYRISPQGKGYVLFEAPRREITAIAVGSNGIIYAASVGDKSHNPLPPLPVQGVATATITIVQPGSMQMAAASASLPEGTEIYALADGQAPRKLWSGKDDVVYALASRPDGLLAVTGNRGHVLKIDDDGSYADVAHLEAQQGLCLAETADKQLFVGSGNTGKLYRFGGTAQKHEYASDVLDAGALARFGRVEVQPGSTAYEIWTRSGNVELPTRGWSDWEGLRDGAIASPAGRFLQWKAVLHAAGDLGSVGVNYLPVNASPVVDEVVVVPGARYTPQPQQGGQQTVNISFQSSAQAAVTFDASSSANPLAAIKDKTAVTVRWAAHDDNGDDLVYSLYLRGDGETKWRLLKDGITEKEKAYSFDAALIPDGGYRIKVLASDAPSHTPGDALTGSKESDRFEIDTTPPAVTALKAVVEPSNCKDSACKRPVLLTFDAEDAASPIAHAEYSLDAGPWQYIEPVGELSDSKREHYEIHLSLETVGGKLGEHLITVRAYDRHDNIGVAKTVIPAEAK